MKKIQFIGERSYEKGLSFKLGEWILYELPGDSSWMLTQLKNNNFINHERHPSLYQGLIELCIKGSGE